MSTHNNQPPYEDKNGDGTIDYQDFRDYDDYNAYLKSKEAGEVGPNTSGEQLSLDIEGIPTVGGVSTVSILIVVSFLFFLLIMFGILALLRRRNRPPDPRVQQQQQQQQLYLQAYAQRPVLRAATAAAASRAYDDKDVNCLNCRLIEMGSMACYEELCPQCGRPPPR